jgi:NAD(P)-dependent dehydrogenase (short-subunit alcohol dehydrogenase family)
MSGAGRLHGRRAIVTGAASGIGRATALRFAQEGAAVLATDIAVFELDGIATMRHDVATERDWEAVAQTARERLGGCDILVNCAAVVGSGSAEDVSLDAWNRLIAVNLTGTMLGCRTAIALMREAGRAGAIVNIASTTAYAALPGDVGYTSSKGAVRMLTKSVAAYCARAGYQIRCNALAPGATDTGMLAVPEEVKQAMAGMSLLGRIASPDEMASAIVYLASDESAFMTGAELLVDGGALAVHPGF